MVKRLYQRRLADILDALPRRRMPARSAAGLAAELARSVAGLHKRGVVDQDLRPPNILLDGRDRHSREELGAALVTGDRHRRFGVTANWLRKVPSYGQLGNGHSELRQPTPLSCLH